MACEGGAAGRAQARQEEEARRRRRERAGRMGHGGGSSARTHRRGHEQRCKALLRIPRVDAGAGSDELDCASLVALRACSHQGRHPVDLLVHRPVLRAARHAFSPAAAAAPTRLAASRHRGGGAHGLWRGRGGVLRAVTPAAEHVREHHVGQRHKAKEHSCQHGICPDEALRLHPIPGHESHAGVGPAVHHDLYPLHLPQGAAQPPHRDRRRAVPASTSTAFLSLGNGAPRGAKTSGAPALCWTLPPPHPHVVQFASPPSMPQPHLYRLIRQPTHTQHTQPWQPTTSQPANLQANSRPFHILSSLPAPRPPSPAPPAVLEGSDTYISAQRARARAHGALFYYLDVLLFFDAQLRTDAPLKPMAILAGRVQGRGRIFSTSRVVCPPFTLHVSCIVAGACVHRCQPTCRLHLLRIDWRRVLPPYWEWPHQAAMAGLFLFVVRLLVHSDHGHGQFQNRSSPSIMITRRLRRRVL